MSRALSTVLAVLLLAGTAMPAMGAEPGSTLETSPELGAPAEIIPGEVVVQLRPGRDVETLRARGLQVIAGAASVEAGRPMRLSTDGRPVDQVVRIM